MKNIITKIFGAGFTIFGIVLIAKGQMAEGLLAMIVGELIDLPIRIKEHLDN